MKRMTVQALNIKSQIWDYMEYDPNMELFSRATHNAFKPLSRVARKLKTLQMFDRKMLTFIFILPLFDISVNVKIERTFQ